MTQATQDPELTEDILRSAVRAADMEAFKAAPVSSVRNPDGSAQRETQAEFTRRIVRAGVTHLIEQGLLTISADAAGRMEAGIPIG
jgi:hypothetical protein